MARDTFIVGRAGAVGPNASATHTTFNENYGTMLQGIEMAPLAEDLATLKQNMAGQATTTEQFNAIAAVSAAEDAARSGDETTVVEKLKAAGTWALDVATKIGVAVATEAIKKASGLA
ncbi:hypothetical protein FHS26_001340 [Rhizobium pisi]|uniref:Uncharacterized protein n=1 Tax=Rhizobium pisi TaxID=574561 RepID=A0A3R9CMK5_9HYPH|nr:MULTISPECIES: hypothetical protein [Rhizobium]MBB3133627.1 hypothetical protein [Rhizobium pisi]MBY5482101.1 hypothetical protein [Rhizobium leguminosarum]RSB81636.1 hypothetical protein EFD55_06655 [Rhizobium pisi]TBE31654.1 hypothetical protein ELH07_02565 [Rhizobium ruizarguesonis]WSH02345.1 hypothetical protein U8P71_04770 [Rhizobium ruizarguesonis]